MYVCVRTCVYVCVFAYARAILMTLHPLTPSCTIYPDCPPPPNPSVLALTLPTFLCPHFFLILLFLHPLQVPMCTVAETVGSVVNTPEAKKRSLYLEVTQPLAHVHALIHTSTRARPTSPFHKQLNKPYHPSSHPPSPPPSRLL